MKTAFIGWYFDNVLRIFSVDRIERDTIKE